MQPQPTPSSVAFRLTGLTLGLVIIVNVIIIGISGEQPTRASTNSAPTVGGCPLFPPNNIWNRDISKLPVHANSAHFIKSIGLQGHVHADFGAGLYNGVPIGIPYVVVPGKQKLVPVHFDYAGESDPGPYPIPTKAPIEGGTLSRGDRHVIIVNSGSCKLYEMFAAYPQSNGSWKAGSGAMWNLNSNALRPKTWTSADAAGLPILPGLVRYDEVAAGTINHALRFTVDRTQRAFLWPARHDASSDTDPNLPPMGLRLRLKASVDISSFSPQNRVILTALKHYGMIVADNGSSWYISGAPDSRWNNEDLHELSKISGSNFEVVDESSLRISPDSGQARGHSVSSTPTPKPSTAHTLSPSSTTTAINLTEPSQAVNKEGSYPGGGDAAGGGWILTLLLFTVGGLGLLAMVAFVALRQRFGGKR
jgi:hypothetical protein